MELAIHKRLKIACPLGIVGSTPISATNLL